MKGQIRNSAPCSWESTLRPTTPRVRAAAAAFGCSKSTVHKDVAVRLRSISPELYPAGACRAGPQQGRAPSAGRGGHPAQIQPPLYKKDRCTVQRSFGWYEPSQALARQLPRKG